MGTEIRWQNIEKYMLQSNYSKGLFVERVNRKKDILLEKRLSMF
jgi:hypothetical protein